MIGIFQRFFSRLRAVFNKSALDADFREELAQHLEAATADGISAGLTPDEARRKAVVALGGVEQIRELHREVRGLPMVENLTRDFRFALRMLRKSPGFTFVAIATLALGIGMNTAMFSMLNGLLLRPLSFPGVEQVFRLDRNSPKQPQANHSADDFIDIREASADFTDLAGLITWGSTLNSTEGPPEIVSVARVTSNYFDVLQVAPERGRRFRPEEELPDQNMVVAISHEYWQSRFGGREDIIGRTVRLDTESVEIVAVMPPLTDVNRITTGIRFPEPFRIFRPLAFLQFEHNVRVAGGVQIIGRLHPGVKVAHARARFATIGADLRRRFPTENSDVSLDLRPIQSTVLRGPNRTITILLIGLSSFVLLIACANLANLLLARSMTRTREFSISAALGASRAQLIRPVVAECLLLATGGAAASICVAIATSRWLAYRFGDQSIPVDFSPDIRVFAFACVVSMFTALLFGLAPALWASRITPHDALKNDSRAMSGSRSQRSFRELLIVGQFALSLVLLAGAIAFIRGIARLRHENLGWNPAPLVTAMINLQGERYTWGEPMTNYHRALRERLLSIPGVENAAVSDDIPATYPPAVNEYAVWSGNPDGDGSSHVAYYTIASPSYFDTIGTRLVRGRVFNEGDDMRSRPVALINASMARELFAGKDPIGQGIGEVKSTGEVAWMTVVGVVEDTRPVEAQSTGISFHVYQPYAQRTWQFALLSVRAATPEIAATLAGPIRQKAAELDPAVALRRITPMVTLIEQQTRVWETINALLVLFAGLGLSLAALGVYGVVSRMVAQRRGEFGIRMALGAQARDILGLVLRASLLTGLVGGALGVIGALVLARYLASVLPIFAESKGAALISAVGILLLVALIANLLPARRATRINPVEVLRSE